MGIRAVVGTTSPWEGAKARRAGGGGHVVGVGGMGGEMRQGNIMDLALLLAASSFPGRLLHRFDPRVILRRAAKPVVSFGLICGRQLPGPSDRPGKKS